MEVFVHPRVMERHPDLTEEDVKTAWDNFVAMGFRVAEGAGQVLAIGFDGTGRDIEMVAVANEGGYLIYHALSPATTKAMQELGLAKDKR